MYSYFRKPRDRKPTHTLDTRQIKIRITSDDIIKKLASKIRNEPDKKERQKLKLQMPAFTPSAILSTRDKNVDLVDKLVKYTGIIGIDIDHETEKDAISTFKKLKKDPMIYWAFISVSGRGVACSVKVDGGMELHDENFDLITSYFKEKHGITIDKGCRDITRLRYFSHGEFYQSHNPATFYYIPEEDISTVRVKRSSSDTSRLKGKIKELCDIISSKGIDITKEYSDWVACGFALVNEYGEDGSDIFHIISQNHPDYDYQSVEDKYQGFIKSFSNTRIAPSISKIFWLARQRGVSVEYNEDRTFWYADKKGLHLELLELKLFLEDQGFRLYYLDDDDYWLVRSINNVVEKWSISKLRRFILNHCSKQGDIIAEYSGKQYTNKNLQESIMAKARWAFSEDKMDFLSPINKNSFIEGSQKTAMFFFNNKFAIVSSEGIDIKSYDKLPEYGYIWKDQIKKFDISDTSQNKSQFDEFLRCICTKSGKSVESHSKEKFLSVRTMIGYLLHTYKNGKRYAIILTDEDSDEIADRGRTGKSEVFAKGISHILPTTFIQAKRADFDSQFIYQKVNISDKIVVINDLPKGIKFDIFYNDVADGLEVEKKRKDTFEIKPKILMTTNSLPGGSGDSVRDRFIEFQFTNFFSATNTPLNHFNNWLFHDWTDEQWNDFYHDMMGYSMVYFKEIKKDRSREKKTYGIIRVEDEGLEEKRIIGETRFEFVQWATPDDNGYTPIKTDERYDKKELMSAFIIDSHLSSITQRTFNKWLFAWATYNNWTVHEQKSMNKYFITFIKKKS